MVQRLKPDRKRKVLIVDVSLSPYNKNMYTYITRVAFKKA